MDKKLESILKRVEKPSRYVGGEIGMPTIDTGTRMKYREMLLHQPLHPATPRKEPYNPLQTLHYHLYGH